MCVNTYLSRIEKSTGAVISTIDCDSVESGSYHSLSKNESLRKIISVSSRHAVSDLRRTILDKQQKRETESGIVRALVVVMGDRAITYFRDSVLKVGDAIVLNVSLSAFDMTTYSVISPTAPTQPACDSVMISLDYLLYNQCCKLNINTASCLQ